MWKVGALSMKSLACFCHFHGDILVVSWDLQKKDEIVISTKCSTNLKTNYMIYVELSLNSYPPPAGARIWERVTSFSKQNFSSRTQTRIDYKPFSCLFSLNITRTWRKAMSSQLNSVWILTWRGKSSCRLVGFVPWNNISCHVAVEEALVTNLFNAFFLQSSLDFGQGQLQSFIHFKDLKIDFNRQWSKLKKTFSFGRIVDAMIIEQHLYAGSTSLPCPYLNMVIGIWAKVPF